MKHKLPQRWHRRSSNSGNNVAGARWPSEPAVTINVTKGTEPAPTYSLDPRGKIETMTGKIHVVMWKWRQANFREAYTSAHVNATARSIRRATEGMDVRLLCVTDDPEGIEGTVETAPLWDDYSELNNACGKHLPSCYRRLKLFDPKTQESLGIQKGDRVCSIDIDAVIVGDLRPLLTRKDRFCGWAVRGTRHPKVYNGSMWLFTAGDLSDVWTDFDPLRSPAEVNKAGFMGSDQSWLSYKLAKREGCGGWAYPQVTSYPRELRHRRLRPAMNTGVVFFHGRDKPWHDRTLREAGWITKYWGK